MPAGGTIPLLLPILLAAFSGRPQSLCEVFHPRVMAISCAELERNLWLKLPLLIKFKI